MTSRTALPADGQRLPAARKEKISTDWLSEFSDAGLKRSVNEALAHNRSPKAATPAGSHAQPAICRNSPVRFPPGSPPAWWSAARISPPRAPGSSPPRNGSMPRRNPCCPIFPSPEAAGARLSDLLNADFLVANITDRVDRVLFDGGALAAGARGALASNDRLVNEYAQLALEAFQEVEATLAADSSLAIQERFLKSEVEQASLAEKQAERDYAEGINPNILSVLEAQRRANNARASIIRLRNQRLQNRFDLHLALGGDFRTE